MKQVFPLLALLALPACIMITPRSAHTSAAAITIPNMPTMKWGIESCGAGSLSTVLRHYGDPTTMQQWDETLPKTRGGVMSVDLLLAARDRGYDARLVTGTPELVMSEIEAGRPVILMLQVVDSPGKHYDFFHYIVADGIDPTTGMIRTQFGDASGRWVSFHRLEQAWSGGAHAAILIHPMNEADSIATALRSAVALEEKGDYAGAASSYRRILEQHPSSSVAWVNLGNVESQMRHATEAEEAFRKALELDGTSADARNNLAWLLYQQHRLEEGEAEARKAVALHGSDAYMPLDTLARILAARGKCGEAATAFQEAIAAVPPGRDEAKQEIEKAAQSRCDAAH